MLFDGGGGEGLAFEWLVEARDGGTCVVRLVNTGFGSGEDWDAQYDGMTEGWLLFLGNLRLHLEHFPGQTATAVLPTATWAGPRDTTWARLSDALGIPATPAVGERIEVNVPDAPTLAGTVADAAPWRVALLLDQPSPGTAILAVEGHGEQVEVSIWSYLYGNDGAAAAAHDEPLWRRWLTERALTADRLTFSARALRPGLERRLAAQVLSDQGFGVPRSAQMSDHRGERRPGSPLPSMFRQT